MVQYKYVSTKPQKPFAPLGRQLKQLRERAHETLAEASGAVEIGVDDLASYETGNRRPSEDILLLLISHFGARDDEAARLWQMAGYNMDQIPATHLQNSGDGSVQPGLVMTVADNTRIVYTDLVHVMVNNHGVVMNFMQGSGPNAQPVAIARVGMSREHAKSVLEVLKTTIEQSEKVFRSPPKKLTSPDNAAPDDQIKN